MSTDYIPISCIFYDKLLDLATLKKDIELSYKKPETADINMVKGIITNIFTKNKEEFLVVNKTLNIRLDYIIQVNNLLACDYKSC